MASFLQSGMESHLIYTSSVDSSLTIVANLFEITMELEQQIEQTRIELSQSTRFYPEQLFVYLRKYRDHRQKSMQKVTSEKSYNNFFKFDWDSNTGREVSQNYMNSSKDGLIGFGDLVDCLQDRQGFACQEPDVQMIERIYHSHQYALGQNQVPDANNDRYPLPADVQRQLDYNKQMIAQQAMQIGNQQNTRYTLTEEELNSGKGINYNTFLKMVLSQAVPAAKNKVLKRKLIYESEAEKLVDQAVVDLVARLFKLEVQLNKKSEILRIQLAQDLSYNPTAIFSAMDSKRDNAIDYESMEHLLQRTQHNLKPKGFTALVRRARVLGGRQVQSGPNVLSFDDFRQLVQVRSPYYKRPIVLNADNQNQTVMISGIKNDKYQVHKTVGVGSNQVSQNYSRLLDTNVDGSKTMNHMNSKLRTVNIDDPAPPKQRPQHSNNASTNIHVESYVQGTTVPNMPIYHSNNLNVTKLIRNQVQPPNQPAQAQQDFVIYGTRKDYDQMQHNLAYGQLQQTKPQPREQEDTPLVRPSTNFDMAAQSLRYEPNYDQNAQQIVGEANQHLKQQRMQNPQFSNREVINAQHTNTKFLNVQSTVQPFQGGLFEGAPWKKIDKQTERNVHLLNNEMADIKRLAGYQTNQPIQPNQPIQTNQPIRPTQPPAQQQQPAPTVQPRQTIPASPSPYRSNRVSARHQIFGEVSQAQQPFQYTDLNNNELLNHRYDGKFQIQPRPNPLNA